MLRKLFFDKKTTVDEKEKPIILDVTQECRESYNKEATRILTIGGQEGSAGEARDVHQAWKDWDRAANPDKGGQEITFFFDKQEISLKELLKNIYEKDGKDNPHHIIPKSSHYTFKDDESLASFFKTYLFSKIKDDKVNDAITERALLNLHQGGLPTALFHHVHKNLAQTSSTKTFSRPSKWKDTLRPLDDGVLLMSEQDYGKLLLFPLEDEPKDGPSLINLQCDSRIYIEQDAKDPSIFEVKCEILRAQISLNAKIVKDYEFGVGFIANYSEKKAWFDKCYQQLNLMHSESKDSKYKNQDELQQTLLLVAENYRFVNFKDLASLNTFEELLRDKLASVAAVLPSKPPENELEEKERAHKNEIFGLLNHLYKEVYDQIKKLKKEGPRK